MKRWRHFYFYPPFAVKWLCKFQILFIKRYNNTKERESLLLRHEEPRLKVGARAYTCFSFINYNMIHDLLFNI